MKIQEPDVSWSQMNRNPISTIGENDLRSWTDNATTFILERCQRTQPETSNVDQQFLPRFEFCFTESYRLLVQIGVWSTMNRGMGEVEHGG